MKTIFGYSHRPYNHATRGRKPLELAKAVQAPSYDLTVFKIKWGNLTLKIYDKGERVLRIEVVVHNAKELRCGKVLEKLPVLLERMNGILVRFLDTVQAAHIAFLDEGAFDAWNEPTARGNRRLAGGRFRVADHDPGPAVPLRQRIVISRLAASRATPRPVCATPPARRTRRG